MNASPAASREEGSVRMALVTPGRCHFRARGGGEHSRRKSSRRTRQIPASHCDAERMERSSAAPSFTMANQGARRSTYLIEQDVPSLEPPAHHFEIVLQLLHASLRILRAERPRHTCNDITTGWMGRRDRSGHVVARVSDEKIAREQHFGGWSGAHAKAHWREAPPRRSRGVLTAGHIYTRSLSREAGIHGQALTLQSAIGIGEPDHGR
jgi:hypothetical protein